jgi:hypothetical protein
MNDLTRSERKAILFVLLTDAVPCLQKDMSEDLCIEIGFHLREAIIDNSRMVQTKNPCESGGFSEINIERLIKVCVKYYESLKR